MTTVATTLAQAAALASADTALFHAWVHGPASGPGSTITTDSGTFNTVARILAEALVSNNVRKATNYTIVAADAGKTFWTDSADDTPITFTFDNELPEFFVCEVVWTPGCGQPIFAADTGATLVPYMDETFDRAEQEGARVLAQVIRNEDDESAEVALNGPMAAPS
jgi:hypothetical protein